MWYKHRWTDEKTNKWTDMETNGPKGWRTDRRTEEMADRWTNGQQSLRRAIYQRRGIMFWTDGLMNQRVYGQVRSWLAKYLACCDWSIWLVTKFMKWVRYSDFLHGTCPADNTLIHGCMELVGTHPRKDPLYNEPHLSYITHGISGIMRACSIYRTENIFHLN